jgi:glycosyltransferase involved in cell wall biosynthesis
MDPAITIITVCRNAARTLQSTIDSVVSQSYRNVEYIIIDGASTDDTMAIVDRQRSTFARVISEADRGIYDAMNKGLRHATGDLVGYIMADDQYLPGALRRVADAWRLDRAADLIVGATRVKNARTGSQSIGRPVYRTAKSGHPYASVPHPSAFVARESYAKYGNYDTTFSISADAELFFRFASCGARLVELPDVLAEFNSGGVSSRNEFAPIREHFRVRRRYGPIVPAAADLIRNTIVHWLLPRVARAVRPVRR